MKNFLQERDKERNIYFLDAVRYIFWNFLELALSTLEMVKDLWD